MSPLIPIIFTALASSALGEEGQARILISKQVRQIHEMTIILYYSIYSHLQINNKYLVEGMDIVVKYNLYNVGDNAATNVQVNSSLTLESGNRYCHRWQTMGSARRTSTWSPDRRSTSWTGLPQAPTPPTPWWSGPRSLVTSTSLLPRWGIVSVLIC